MTIFKIKLLFDSFKLLICCAYVGQHGHCPINFHTVNIGVMELNEKVGTAMIAFLYTKVTAK